MKELPNEIHRTWDEYNLSADTELDKFNLDTAAEVQSSLMDKWLELIAQAQDNLVSAKNFLAETEATLQLQARQGGCSHIPKVTDTVVKSWVTLQPLYKEAVRKKDKAESRVAHLQNAKVALEHKKAMIQVESNLWICGYYARPNISGEVQKLQDDSRREQTAEILRETLRKRKHAEVRGSKSTDD